MEIKRGDIVLVDFNPEIGKQRPALVIQISSANISKEIPTLVKLSKEESGLNYNSIINCSQIRAIDKKRIVNKLKKININLFYEIDKAIIISLGIKVNVNNI